MAGIGTDVGKTLVSAILCAGLKCDYWKPIQSGLTSPTDTEWVKQMSGLPDSHFHPEAFRLQLPASPHFAARAEGIQIAPEDIRIPETSNRLLIELAGGLAVPINDKGLLTLDLLAKWKLPVVLVMQNYLGSINHSLLSIEALRTRNIPILGLILNEGAYPESGEAVLEITKLPLLATIPKLDLNQSQNLKAIFEDAFGGLLG